MNAVVRDQGTFRARPFCPIRRDRWTQTRASPGPNIRDLTQSLAHGNTIADAASMLCRDEDEVRQKAKELGLVEHPRLCM
jgi:hypothetical protein